MGANATGISIYILGLKDKKYLAKTYGKELGKSSITGYCIKFRRLEDIDTAILGAACGMELSKQAPGPQDPSRSVALCMEGSEAEFHGLLDEAGRCFWAAWISAVDDRDRCVAAHYLGHLEDDPAVAHEWNLVSMRFALLSDPNAVEAFMPSLLVNLGRTHELTGNKVEAARFYAQARHLGLEHSTLMLGSTTSLRVLSIPRDDPLTSNNA